MKNKKPKTNITIEDVNPNIDNIVMPEETNDPDVDNIIINDN